MRAYVGMCGSALGSVSLRSCSQVEAVLQALICVLQLVSFRAGGACRFIEDRLLLWRATKFLWTHLPTVTKTKLHLMNPMRHV